VVLRLGAIRDAVLRSPAVLALGVESAARAPEVDPSRIALVGVSLGVPPAVSVLRLTPRPAALVLLHGAADLRALLRHGLVRQGVPGALAMPLAALAARLVRPLEPSLHASAAGSRPVLLINAASDPLLPAATVERLHRLFPAAEVRWRAGLHGARERRAIIAEATREVQAWLAAGPP
jgi:dienelactone hydrolase